MSAFSNRQWQFEQGADPADDFWLGELDSDQEFHITSDGCCSGCEYEFGPGELDLPTSIFVAEKSGITPDTPDGPGVHWVSGYIECPNCGVHLPYEASS